MALEVARIFLFLILIAFIKLLQGSTRTYRAFVITGFTATLLAIKSARNCIFNFNETSFWLFAYGNIFFYRAM
jgi:hypothetical protein